MLNLCLALIDDPDDKIKFEHIVLNYEKQLFYRANEIIKDEGLAEDAVQTVFFSLAKEFNKISSLNEQIIKARLYIMVKNASINIIKNKKHLKEVFLCEMDESLPDLNIDIESIADSNIGHEKLVKTICDLPEHYREVLYLEQVNDCSIKEIAAITNLKYDTVQKRLKRAKTIMREKLGKEDVIYG